MATKQISTSKRAEVEREVCLKISRATMQSLVTFCTDHVQDHPVAFYGGYGVEDVAWVYVYYLCSNLAYSKLQRKTGIPKSNYKQIFGTFRRILILWADARLQDHSDQTTDQRAAIAQRLVQDQEFRTTFVMDGTKLFSITSNSSGVHCRVWKPPKKKDRKANASFKLYGKTARNYIVAVSHDEVIRYVSYGFGARSSDIVALDNCATNLKAVTNWTRGDSILADGGFRGTDGYDTTDDMKFVIPHKKPHRQQLSDDKKRWNTRLSSVRSKVERVFGKVLSYSKFITYSKLKLKFGVLNMFRGTIERHEDIFRICCALYNCCLLETINQAATRVDAMLN